MNYRQKPMTGIPFKVIYPKIGIQYICIKYGQLALVSIYIKKLEPQPEEQTPCYSWFSGGIICGRGSFAALAVQSV